MHGWCHWEVQWTLNLAYGLTMSVCVCVRACMRVHVHKVL